MSERATQTPGSVWDPLRRELDAWARDGAVATFWVRDDDASTVTTPLELLGELAARYEIQVGLAAIPGLLDAKLVDYLGGHPASFLAMCHGWRHMNYGSAANPAEFGPQRSFSALRTDASFAFDAFTKWFGPADAVFVPPYGRIVPDLIGVLPEIGFVGVSIAETALERRLSRLTARFPWAPRLPLPNPREIPHFDVQIDLIDWQRRSSKAPPSMSREIIGHLRLRRNGLVPLSRPIGLLTHHLVHDRAIWALCDDVLSVLSGHHSVKFAKAREIVKGREKSSRSQSFAY